MRFRVNGLPAPQGSKRHVGGGRMVESSRAVGPWREAVRAEAQRAADEARECCTHPGTGLCMCDCHDGYPLMTRPVSVTIVFVLPRPESHFSTAKGKRNMVRVSAPPFPVARRKNDIDKLARSTLDALVDGGVMADDAQVAALNCTKVYARDGEAPGAVIDVEAMM